MEDRWAKLEEIVERITRKVVREEIEKLQKPAKSKVGFKNGQFTGIGEIELAALAAAYPAVDVAKQIREASAWILMNPGDAPASNYGRFINTWMAKHQNTASLRAINAPVRPTETKNRTCAYCPRGATGSVGGIDCCDAHTTDAMDRKPRAA